jgi:hypothetical protein
MINNKLSTQVQEEKPMTYTEQQIAQNFDSFLYSAGCHRWGSLEKMIRKAMKARGDNKIPKDVWISWLTNIVNFQAVNDGLSVITYLQGTRQEFRELFLEINTFPELKETLIA